MARDVRGLTWLQQNKNAFETQDGLPGAFHREHLYTLIRPGKSVMIELPRLESDPVGQLSSGRAVMQGPGGWVLNMGGAHGTPKIASETNTVWVQGASALKVG